MKKWIEVCKLDKRKAFAGNPIVSFHKFARSYVPEIENVSDIAVTPATNEYLKQKILKYLEKKGAYRLEFTVAMWMLQYSPADGSPADGGEKDFYLYRRADLATKPDPEKLKAKARARKKGKKK